MPHSCAAVDCGNRSSPGCGLRFFRFPSERHQKARRERWITALLRCNKDGTPWEPTSNSRVCSDHFYTGAPERRMTHPDYVPSIFCDRPACADIVQKLQLELVQQAVRTPGTSLTANVHIVAMQPGVDSRCRVLCRRETQATISTADAGTQCALRFVSSSGSQTEAHFSGTQADTFQLSVLAERPAVQERTQHPAGAPAEVQGGHPACSCCPHAGDIRKLANSHVPMKIAGELCACWSCQQCKRQGTTVAVCKRKHCERTPHVCSVCQRLFRRKHDVLSHMKTHTGERPYPCSFCQKSFLNKSYLHIHERSHTGERPYACHICPQRYARSDSLRIHVRTHSTERPFVCSVCNKNFAVKMRLAIHERLHSGEKPFVCSICEARFTTKSALVTHERLRHNIEKCYTCNVCPESFTRKADLCIHERLHTV